MLFGSPEKLTGGRYLFDFGFLRHAQWFHKVLTSAHQE